MGANPAPPKRVNSSAVSRGGRGENKRWKASSTWEASSITPISRVEGSPCSLACNNLAMCSREFSAGLHSPDCSALLLVRGDGEGMFQLSSL